MHAKAALICNSSRRRATNVKCGIIERNLQFGPAENKFLILNSFQPCGGYQTFTFIPLATAVNYYAENFRVFGCLDCIFHFTRLLFWLISVKSRYFSR